MSKNTPSYRSPLGRAKGLGSAHNGTGHWWSLRVTSIALLVLSLFVLKNFFLNVATGGYQDAIDWLSSPFSSTFVVLFVIVSLHHTANGLQVVIEDYVHGEKTKILLILAVKFFAVLLGALGTLSIIKIFFWSMLPNA